MDTSAVPAGTIVVGVDGSPSGERALRWAIDQAIVENRDLTVVHALLVGDTAWLAQAGVDEGVLVTRMREEALGLLELAREDAEKRAPGITVHEALVVGDPRQVLVDLSREAAMVVLGSRGRGPVRSLLLGSVGVAVMRHAHCPVVIHRPGHPGLVRHGVLVGVDGTEHSRPALEFAFAQASLSRLPLTVLHCYWADPLSTDDSRERLLLAEAIAGLQERYPDVGVTREVQPGAPEHVLVRRGEQMDLLVVGAHVGGLGSEVLFGSVAASVVEHARCPVAVVR